MAARLTTVAALPRAYGLSAIQVDGKALSIAWGRLEEGREPNAWVIDLETIPFGELPLRDYTVQIRLKDGRTLAGDATLVATNGRRFHFESLGGWSALAEGGAES